MLTEYDDPACRCKLEKVVASKGIQGVVSAVPDSIEQVVLQPVERVITEPVEEGVRMPVEEDVHAVPVPRARGNIAGSCSTHWRRYIDSHFTL